MAKASSASKKSSSSKKSNQNYATNLSKGGSVSVKNGVKTYSDKPLQVTGNKGISISGQSYSKDKGGTGFDPVIKAGAIGTTTPTLPTPTVTTAPNAATGNVGLTGGTTGVTLGANGMLTPDPVEQYISQGQAELDKMNASLGQAFEDKPTAGEIQRKVERDSGLRQARQQVNDYSAQINNIIAQRDASVLSVEGQGRGIPEVIIGGQQSQINKEAAIKALPVQALLANAQGNLDTAREYVNTWGKILMDDANNKYNNQVRSIEATYNFATNAQKLRFDSLQAQLKEKKDKEIAVANAKTKAISQALAQNAPPTIVQAIQSATDENGVVTALGKYNGDLLAQEAQRANIAQSYASIANSNTDRLLKLASSGDSAAIKKLGFNPNTIKEEVDPVTKRQLAGAVDSSANLLRLAGRYKDIIDKNGYTNTITGDPTLLGEISSLRALMTAEYKKAETLGTLDAGVLALMSQIVGEEPTSTYNPFTNITGRKSERLSSQIGTFIDNVTANQARDKARLGIEPSVDFSVIAPEDDAEINSAYGVTSTSTPSGAFNPATYF